MMWTYPAWTYPEDRYYGWYDSNPVLTDGDIKSILVSA